MTNPRSLEEGAGRAFPQVSQLMGWCPREEFKSLLGHQRKTLVQRGCARRPTQCDEVFLRAQSVAGGAGVVGSLAGELVAGGSAPAEIDAYRLVVKGVSLRGCIGADHEDRHLRGVIVELWLDGARPGGAVCPFRPVRAS